MKTRSTLLKECHFIVRPAGAGCGWRGGAATHNCGQRKVCVSRICSASRQEHQRLLLPLVNRLALNLVGGVVLPLTIAGEQQKVLVWISNACICNPSFRACRVRLR